MINKKFKLFVSIFENFGENNYIEGELCINSPGDLDEENQFNNSIKFSSEQELIKLDDDYCIYNVDAKNTFGSGKIYYVQ